MYVYSTYLHVIGVIIKKTAEFVWNLKAQEFSCWLLLHSE